MSIEEYRTELVRLCTEEKDRLNSNDEQLNKDVIRGSLSGLGTALYYLDKFVLSNPVNFLKR